MTPLCKVDVTLPGVRGASGVRDVGGVDEQEGIRSARNFAGRSVWPSACRGRLRAARPEAAAGVSVAGRFETRGHLVAWIGGTGALSPTRVPGYAVRHLVAWINGVGALSPTRVPGHAIR